MWQALRQAATQLGGAVPVFVLGAVLVYGLSVLTAALRWRVILHGMGGIDGKRARLRDTFLTYMSSIFVHNVTPGRVGGDIYRVAMLRRRTGLPTQSIVASVAYDRVTDIIPIALFIVLSLPTLKHVLVQKGLGGAASSSPGALKPVYWVLGGLVILLSGLLIAGRTKRVRAWLESWRMQLRAISLKRRDFGLSVGLGFLLWGQDLLRLILVAAALHVSLSPWQAIPLSMIALLGGLFPTVGGLGAIEGGLTAALCLFDVGLDRALAITALERGISYVLATGTGGLVLLLIGGGELWRRSSQGPVPAQGEGDGKGQGDTP